MLCHSPQCYHCLLKLEINSVEATHMSGCPSEFDLNFKITLAVRNLNCAVDSNFFSLFHFFILEECFRYLNLNLDLNLDV